VTNPDTTLRDFVAAIVTGDGRRASQLLAASPPLAQTSFQTGATRHSENSYYLTEIGRYIWTGDTALHIAAAAYQTEMVRKLLASGANVRAKNRLGDQPLHSAAVGQPGSPMWNPRAQEATIVCLIKAGADPNAFDKTGASPLHRAIRTRCAMAVRALLERGADPELRNRMGSTPTLLATQNTGRGGTGTPESKAQQAEILRLLTSSWATKP
jgi:hypothetical protein